RRDRHSFPTRRSSDLEGDVPVRAVTVGLHQLLGARTIVVVVSGSAKHGVVHRALEGPIGPEVPASFLRRSDADVTVLVDRAAWRSEEHTSELQSLRHL